MMPLRRFALLLALTFAACAREAAPLRAEPEPLVPCPVIDTVAVHARADSLQERADSLIAHLHLLTLRLDTAVARSDSLATELFLSRLTVEKVRFYVQLVLKKPSQEKFLKGWVRRAVGL